MTRHEEARERFLPVREFKDARGRNWIAGMKVRTGPDFKGRFFFVARPKNSEPAGDVWLEDVRWNSEEAAEGALRTMSDVELRRRLRSALGRSSRPLGSAHQSAAVAELSGRANEAS